MEEGNTAHIIGLHKEGLTRMLHVKGLARDLVYSKHYNHVRNVWGRGSGIQFLTRPVGDADAQPKLRIIL